MKNEQSQSQPIIFVIDELDRCRPPYAIELLEKIKHLFSVKGLVFVLAIDKCQLRESVKALYGAGMDADGYLRRFIDMEYRLPEPNIENFINAQFARFGLSEVLAKKVGSTSTERGNLLTALTELFKLFGFSFRVQEQIFTQLSAVIRTTPSNCYLYGFHLALLICLRTINRDLYSRYVQGMSTPKDVMEFLGSFPQGQKFMHSRNSCIIEAHLIVGIKDWKIREQTVEFINKQVSANAGDEVMIKRAQEVRSHFGWVGDNANDMTGYLFQKIELAQRFTKEDQE